MSVGLVRRFWHNVLSDVQETTLAPRSTARNLHGAQHLSARSSRSHSLNDDVLHGSLLAPARAALLFSLAWRDCEIDVVARSIVTVNQYATGLYVTSVSDPPLAPLRHRGFFTCSEQDVKASTLLIG